MIDDETALAVFRVAGCQPIILSEVNCKYFLHLANQGVWDEVKDLLTTEQFAKVPQLYTKK